MKDTTPKIEQKNFSFSAPAAGSGEFVLANLACPITVKKHRHAGVTGSKYRPSGGLQCFSRGFFIADSLRVFIFNNVR
jgi:hypothetical protein